MIEYYAIEQINWIIRNYNIVSECCPKIVNLFCIEWYSILFPDWRVIRFYYMKV